MTKASGLGARLYVAGYDISGDVGEVGAIGGGNDPLVVTGLTASGFERIGGKRDGRLDFTSFFNDATGQEHAALKGLPTADVLVSYLHRATIGAPSAHLMAKQLNYDPTRGADGSLTEAVNTVANGYGLEWADQLTPGLVTVTGNGSQSSVDYGAAVGTTAFGAQAYLQVTDFVGTGVAVVVDSSSDNGVGDPWAPIISFSVSAAGRSFQRVATASPTTSVERYLRATVTAFPAFTSLTYSLAVVKNLAASAVF